jgi:hypothetical protein
MIKNTLAHGAMATWVGIYLAKSKSSNPDAG